MGTFYEVSGTIDVRYATPEEQKQVDALIAAYNEVVGSDMTIEGELADPNNEFITINFDGGSSMSYSTAEEVDDAMRAFGPFVVTPVIVLTRCDDAAEEEIYIGPPEQEATTRSSSALSKTLAQFDVLTVTDLKALMLATTAAIRDRDLLAGVTVERTAGLTINAPQWFIRPDFVAFLSSDMATTWHHKGSDIADEQSDLFVVFDHGESSDFTGSTAGSLPVDIWEAICRAAATNDFTSGVIRITNTAE